MQLLGIGLELVAGLVVDDGDLRLRQVEVGELAGDVVVAGEEDRVGDPLVDQDLGGAQDLVVLAFGEDHPLGCPLGAVDDAAHQLQAARDQGLQPPVIGLSRRSAGGRRRCPCGAGPPAAPTAAPGSQWLGDDVVAAEAEAVEAVGAEHGVRHVLARQLGQGVHGRQLHGVVDVGGPHVEGTAEEEGEAQDVVDLVGEVAAAGGDDGVRAGVARLLVADLGIGVGHREDHGVGRHRADHVARDDAAHREADEDVGGSQGLGQGAGRRVGRQLRLVGVHVLRPAAIDHAGLVAEDELGRIGAELGRAGAGGAAAPAPEDVRTSPWPARVRA